MHFADILVPSCALFLDFDGTLVDIAPEPDAVVVPAGLIGTLDTLNHYLGGALALISGRPIAQIDEFLHPLQLPAAGVHGAERRTASGELVLLAIHPLDNVEAAAQALAQRHPELHVESKRGSIALHYRQAPQLGALVHREMRALLASAGPDFQLLVGKRVVEILPGGSNKGLAVRQFMQEPPFRGRTPAFVGDDVTDEHAFAIVNGLAGYSVKVGPGPTLADWRLDDVTAVRAWLES